MILHNDAVAFFLLVLANRVILQNQRYTCLGILIIILFLLSSYLLFLRIFLVYLIQRYTSVSWKISAKLVIIVDIRFFTVQLSCEQVNGDHSMHLVD